ncbi:hypothetical protein GCM10009646_61890 [Streptomyces aureus]
MTPPALATKSGAVIDDRPGISQPRKELTEPYGEEVLSTVPSWVQPPHLAARATANQRMQHGEHRSHSHTGRQQHHRSATIGQTRRTARCGDVEDVTNPEVSPQMVTRRTMRFDLHIDPVCARPRFTGQGIAPDQRQGIAFGPYLHGEKLPRQIGRQRGTIGGSQGQGEHALTFGLDARDRQGTEAGPRRGWVECWPLP